MPKKIRFESFVYRFSYEASQLIQKNKKYKVSDFKNFLKSIKFKYKNKKVLLIIQNDSKEIVIEESLKNQLFYIRADKIKESINIENDTYIDNIMTYNKKYFLQVIEKCYKKYLLLGSNSNIPHKIF